MLIDVLGSLCFEVYLNGKVEKVHSYTIKVFHFLALKNMAMNRAPQKTFPSLTNYFTSLR